MPLGFQSQAVGNVNGINAGKFKCHILINRCHFFLNHALILVLDKNDGQIFRLVVYHNGKFLTDLVYYSLRGAKIAFIKDFKDRAYSDDVKAQWSETEVDLNKLSPPFPQLTPLWFEERLNGSGTTAKEN